VVSIPQLSFTSFFEKELLATFVLMEWIRIEAHARTSRLQAKSQPRFATLTPGGHDLGTRVLESGPCHRVTTPARIPYPGVLPFIPRDKGLKIRVWKRSKPGICATTLGFSFTNLEPGIQFSMVQFPAISLV
jgi:hypothetical protein